MLINPQFFGFIILVIIIFLIGEFLLKYHRLDSELTRRLTHFFSGIVVFFMPLCLSLTQAVVIGSLFAVILLFAERLKILPSITKVTRKSYGSVLFPIGLVASGLLFWNTNTSAFQLSVLVLAISDSAAGVVGHKFGRKKFLTGTTVGSLAFFLITTVIFVSFGLLLGRFAMGNLFYFATFSLILTIVEAGTTRGLDNLVLPPIAGLLASLLF